MRYSIEFFKHDLMAALTVALVASPQSMAYAVIAGVDPVYGLYASVLPVFIGALFGSSRFLIGGPTNSISMLLYTTMMQISIGGVILINLPDEQKLIFVFALSFIAGVIQVLLGLSKLGRFANFLSYPVIVAYSAGCALLIVIGQIKNFFGFDFPNPTSTLELLTTNLIHIDEIHLWSVGIGVATLVLTVLIGKLGKSLPNYLLALIAMTFMGYFAELRSKGVQMADFITAYIPPLTNPIPEVFSYFDVLFFPALAIAIISSVDSIANGRSLANRKGDKFDVNKELIGQGLAKLSGSFTSSIPGSGSFSRSAVNYIAGAKTRCAAMMSAGFTLLAVVLFGSFIGYLPIPALAAMLFLIAYNMIKPSEITFIWRASMQDRIVFAITFASIVFLSLDKAIIVGVLLSLGLFLNSEAQLKIEKIRRNRIHTQSSEWVLDRPDVAAYTLEGAFFFGATSVFENTLSNYDDDHAHIIILHLTRVHTLDASGAYALKVFLKKVRHGGMAKVIISGANPEVLQVIHSVGLNKGPKGCFIAGNLDGAIELTEFFLTCLEEGEEIDFM